MITIGVYTATQTFDSSFQGPIKILLDNKSRFDLPILVGDKIAELIILPLDPPLVSYLNLFEDNTDNTDNTYDDELPALPILDHLDLDF